MRNTLTLPPNSLGFCLFKSASLPFPLGLALRPHPGAAVRLITTKAVSRMQVKSAAHTLSDSLSLICPPLSANHHRATAIGSRAVR